MPGERLLFHAESIESSAASIQNNIAGEKFALSGAVRIGAPDGFGAFFLAPRIGKLIHRHPQLELQIVAMPRIFSLTKREADIAIGLERPVKGRLYSRKLTDYTLHVYASRNYLEENKSIRCPQDFAAHPFIGYIPELIFAPQLDYLGLIGNGLTPRLSSNNLFAQLHATQAGAGLCILPDFMVRNAPDLVPLIPDQASLERTFWIIAHQDSRDSARIQTVIRFVVEQAERERILFRPHDAPSAAN